LLLADELDVGYYAFARPLWCALHYLDFNRSYRVLKIFISLRCSSHANEGVANIAIVRVLWYALRYFDF